MGYSTFQPRGLRHFDPDKSCPGYVLFTPMGGDRTLLIDKQGFVVHEWRVTQPLLAYWGFLLDNGNLLLRCIDGTEQPRIGGASARIVELDRDSNVIWQYHDPQSHHDHARLRNGNTLLLGRRLLTADYGASVRGGLAASGTGDGTILCDYLREVTPAGRTVWEWHAEDAFEFDSDVICPLEARAEWSHGNSVAEMPDGSLLLSFRNTNAVAILDRRSGRFSWRLQPDVTSHQHDATALASGNLLIFDNGDHRLGGAARSRVIEMDPRTGAIAWEYTATPEDSFFSARVGGAERLPNGNTLICEGRSGRLFEVTPQREIVWEYLNPCAISYRDQNRSWSVFKARHYGFRP